MNLYLENNMECDQKGLRSSYVLSFALFSKSGRIRWYALQSRKSAKQGISPERATKLFKKYYQKRLEALLEHFAIISIRI